MTQMKQKMALLYFFRVPYYGDKGCSLIKSSIRKIKSNCKKELSIKGPFKNDVIGIEGERSTQN